MPLPLRRALAAAVSAARLRRRGLSTAATIPPWAIIQHTRLVNSPDLTSSLLLAEPPRASHLLVPAHLVNARLHPDSAEKPLAVLGGMVRATSRDGLLLVQFVDGTSTMGPTVSKLRTAGGSESHHEMEPDITRFVCNPLSCDLFRLPDIDGMKKVKIPTWHPQGLLTRSVRGHGPPDRYAVAELSVDSEGEEQSFVMRRFLSDTGEWEKLVGLPSPLPLPRLQRRINMDHEVVAFAGRLYWVDLTWGAISADPFSDRPELRFTELPRDSVMPVPSKDQAALSMHRRMGVSEGRLRYVEMSQEDPFLLSSFTLGSDGRSWTLEHQVVFARIDVAAGANDIMPRIGVIDPLNASIAHLVIGNASLAVEMSTGKVLQKSRIDEAEVVSPGQFVFSAFLTACVLPPWLESSRIPPAGEFRMSIVDMVVQS